MKRSYVLFNKLSHRRAFKNDVLENSREKQIDGGSNGHGMVENVFAKSEHNQKPSFKTFLFFVSIAKFFKEFNSKA